MPNKCGDCCANEGELHMPGCDMERCRICGGQFTTCNCGKAKLKARVPFIYYPILCARCGKAWAELFMVPNAEWKRYIQRDQWRSVICRECFDFIKSVTDSYASGALVTQPNSAERWTR